MGNACNTCTNSKNVHSNKDKLKDGTPDDFNETGEYIYDVNLELEYVNRL